MNENINKELCIVHLRKWVRHRAKLKNFLVDPHRVVYEIASGIGFNLNKYNDKFIIEGIKKKNFNEDQLNRFLLEHIGWILLKYKIKKIGIFVSFYTYFEFDEIYNRWEEELPF